eukprot:7380048-Prymnesium_polylepis.1
MDGIEVRDVAVEVQGRPVTDTDTHTVVPGQPVSATAAQAAAVPSTAMQQMTMTTKERTPSGLLIGKGFQAIFPILFLSVYYGEGGSDMYCSTSLPEWALVMGWVRNNPIVDSPTHMHGAHARCNALVHTPFPSHSHAHTDGRRPRGRPALGRFDLARGIQQSCAVEGQVAGAAPHSLPRLRLVPCSAWKGSLGSACFVAPGPCRSSCRTSYMASCHLFRPAVGGDKEEERQ